MRMIERRTVKGCRPLFMLKKRWEWDIIKGICIGDIPGGDEQCLR